MHVMELVLRHPDMNIQINYMESQYNQTRNLLLTGFGKSRSYRSNLLRSDLAWRICSERAFNRSHNSCTEWGRSSDWYEENWQGGNYEGRVYGIWTWTDVRGIWYWKDLLNKAHVDPNMLKTWEGYVGAAKRA